MSTSLSLLTIIPLLVVTGAVGLTLTQTSLLIAHRLKWRLATLSIITIVGITLYFLWHLIYAGPAFSSASLNNSPLFYLNDSLKPLFLSLLLIGLLVSTITDLRERTVISFITAFPIYGTILLLVANWVFGWSHNAAGGLIVALIAILVCGGVTKLMGLLANAMSGERGEQVDEELAAALPELENLRFSDFALPFIALIITALCTGLAWANANGGLVVLAWVSLIPSLTLALRPRQFSGARAWQKMLAFRRQLPFYKKGSESGQNPPLNEDFGTGDIWIMVLIAILLGPINGFMALGLGILINAVVIFPMFVYDRVRKTTTPHYVPLVPPLALAALLMLVRF
jgi:hypothetical protein